MRPAETQRWPLVLKALMTAHVMEMPTPLADKRAGLPPPLAALVMQALAKQADEADGRVARGQPLGRAHGLPVVIKDVMKLAGLACSGGGPVLR